MSTVGVGDHTDPSAFTEDADVRVISPTRTVDDSYANGYANSKWAGEVLLREAHDLCSLPVAVFRCDMILVDTKYAGHLNVPDMFTRMMLSHVATGIAPRLVLRDRQGRQEATSALRRAARGLHRRGDIHPRPTGGGRVRDLPRHEPARRRHRTRRICRLADRSRLLHPARIPDYAAWLQRFETAMRALPDRQRQHSLLPLLHNYQRPAKPINGSMAPTDRFRSAVQKAKIGADKDIPHVSSPVIIKYITNLQLLDLL